MPPIYDFGCSECNEVTSPIFSYDEYDAVDEMECEHCGAQMTKDHRIISGNIKKIVRGVGKGNFNGNDFS